jgi:hypothetical protein
MATTSFEMIGRATTTTTLILRCPVIPASFLSPLVLLLLLLGH